MDNYKEKVEKASEAVSGIKDEVLKKIAFEKILEDLLGNNSHVSNPKKTAHISAQFKRSCSSSKPRTFSQEGKVSPEQKSEIKLGVEKLNELKDYYDAHAPKSAESMVFILAYFIHEKLKIQKFSVPDIVLIYNSVLSVRTKNKPIPLTPGYIRRALNWVVAPSRHKQWLSFNQKDGTYEVSPQGTIHMNYQDKSPNS